MNANDQPDAVSAVIEAMLPAIEKVRDVAGGWSRMLAKGGEYLPQHPKETPQNYRIRSTRPTFFNAFARTIGGLTGMVFRRNPVLAEDVPPEIVGHWENIDNQGTHGDVFARDLFKDATEAGHSIILVDMPSVPAGLSLADERNRGIRPYWVHIKPEAVVNRRTVVIDGQTVLQQFTFKETTYEPAGKYGDKRHERFKTFTLDVKTNVVTWVVNEKRQNGEGKDEWVEASKGTLGNVTRIPVAVVYGNRTGYMRSKPPLEDLADLNILNYQTLSDYYHAHHIACVPMLATIGAGQDNKIEIGPNSTLQLPEGADAKWVETSGAALGHSKELIQEQKGDMATLGLNMLAREKRTAETASAKRLDKAEADSALALIARSLEDAVEAALAFHAGFMKLAQGGGSISINRDYEDQTLTPAEIQAISQMVAAGQLSNETMWDILVRGEILPPDFDAELEQSRLDEAMIPGMPSQSFGQAQNQDQNQDQGQNADDGQ